ncbi:MAG: hypothetical protein O2954_00500 [bacterium]|nr:hypothetical protein [bacterium]
MVRCGFLLVVAFLFCISKSAADVPRLINYQGSLQTSTDSLLTGSVRIVFSVYSTETGGSPLWSETHTLQAIEGRFHALLGSLVALPPDLFSSNNRYLSLKIEEDTELLPRQQIVSTAYAFRAGQADDVSGRHISPASITLERGNATLDTAGTLSASRVFTDSLAVGGLGVINRNGNWVGPAIPIQTTGMTLDTIIVKSTQDTLRLDANLRWEQLEQPPFGSLFVQLDRPSLVELDFRGAIAANGSLEFRLGAERFEGGNRTALFRNASNVSGIAPSPDGSQTFRTSTVSNSAVLSLETGLYRIFIEIFATGQPGTLRTGILLIKIYTR